MVKPMIYEMPQMTQRNFKEWLTNINISKEKIKKKLLELKISKAPGPDGLHPRLLKALAAQLSEPLELTFQLSLKQGKVPNDWKKGWASKRKETEEQRGTTDQ